MFTRYIMKRILAFMLSVLVLTATLAPTLAVANPTAASKQAQAQQVAKEVEALDAKLDAANENYNIANIAYNEALNRRKAADAKLQETEARLAEVQLHLNTRATDMYRNGATGFADVIFGAKSFGEFAALWDLMNDLNRSDAVSSMELKDLQEETIALREELLTSEAEAKAQNDSMKTIKKQAESDLATRKAKLRGLEAEVAALQAAEAARQKASFSSNAGKQFPPPTNAPRSEVVNIAKRYLGAPYKWGAAGPNSFDCSGFTMFVYRQVGVSLPHSSRAQINVGQRVSRADLQPGDLVFFRNPIGHVGIYVGGGQMIHSPQTGDVVKISNAFRSDYVGACRP